MSQHAPRHMKLMGMELATRQIAVGAFLFFSPSTGGGRGHMPAAVIEFVTLQLQSAARRNVSYLELFQYGG